MIPVLSDILGVVIAGSILAGVHELRGIRNEIRRLDLRVSRLEWLFGERVSHGARRPDDTDAAP